MPSENAFTFAPSALGVPLREAAAVQALHDKAVDAIAFVRKSRKDVLKSLVAGGLSEDRAQLKIISLQEVGAGADASRAERSFAEAWAVIREWKAKLVQFAAADFEPKPNELEGLWTMRSLRVGDEEMPLVGKVEAQFTADEITMISFAGKDEPFGYEIDLSHEPKHITFVRKDEDGTSMYAPGIYQIDGEELIICSRTHSSSGPRPHSFVCGDGLQMMKLHMPGRPASKPAAALSGGGGAAVGGAGVTAKAAAPASIDEVLGEWIAEELETDRGKMDAEGWGLRVFIKADSLVMKQDGREDTTDYDLTIDATASPKHFDLRKRESGTKEWDLGTYEVDGDVLRICNVKASAKEELGARFVRPSHISGGDHHYGMTLRRIKAAPAADAGPKVEAFLGKWTVTSVHTRKDDSDPGCYMDLSESQASMVTISSGRAEPLKWKLGERKGNRLTFHLSFPGLPSKIPGVLILNDATGEMDMRHADPSKLPAETPDFADGTYYMGCMLKRMGSPSTASGPNPLVGKWAVSDVHEAGKPSDITNFVAVITDDTFDLGPSDAPHSGQKMLYEIVAGHEPRHIVFTMPGRGASCHSGAIFQVEANGDIRLSQIASWKEEAEFPTTLEPCSTCIGMRLKKQ